jgi:hypothetical protein
LSSFGFQIHSHPQLLADKFQVTAWPALAGVAFGGAGDAAQGRADFLAGIIAQAQEQAQVKLKMFDQLIVGDLGFGVHAELLERQQHGGIGKSEAGAEMPNNSLFDRQEKLDEIIILGIDGAFADTRAIQLRQRLERVSHTRLWRFHFHYAGFYINKRNFGSNLLARLQWPARGGIADEVD